MCPNDLSKKAQVDVYQKFGYILANNPAIIYTSSVGGNWAATFVSENIRTHLGYDPEEFIGEPGFWISHVHPDDRERILANVESVFKTGFHAHDYRFLKKDGTYIWIHDELSLIYDLNGKPIEAVGFMMDITDRKKTEEELKKYDEQLQELVKQRTAELQEANEALLKREKQLHYEKNMAEDARNRMETYFDFMTHDITNMVTPISLYTEIVRKSESFPEDTKEYLIKLSDQIMRLNTFLSRIRILAEAENVLPWDSAPVKLSEVILEYRKILQQRYLQKQITFEYDLSAMKSVESIGGIYVREAILELLDNAVKHSKNDLVNIELNIFPITGTHNEPFWRISIADCGPGISTNIKQNLIKPFDPSKRGQRMVASGLSFVSTIIEHFNGKIWIEDRSKDGHIEGSICYIEIPKYVSKRPRKKKK